MTFSKAARKYGYKSGLEKTVADQIKKRGLRVKYEDPSSRISFTQPATDRTYTPDFVLPNGIVVETKGRFTLEDRKKHLWIQEQTDYDIRFVFSNSRAKIRKGSKTSYADWCDKHGFIYADKLIPEDWFNETRSKKR
mgnify:CR=1 FL=1|tara:strand:- start:153 stop:563 length:411 start_codon:yes stop_codon:yes gene_type:complete